jgi:hypothetical protein
MCDEEATIVGQYFFIRERYIGEYFFSPGFGGWVECKVGSDKYLIHTLKKKSVQHILDSEFFQEAKAQFYYEFDDMQAARLEFARGHK